MASHIEQAELLAQVAHLYFENGHDQGAIARRLKVSRSSVSRLLTQARRQGIVEIRIHYPLPTLPEVARVLQERFGLKEAHILKTTGLDGPNAPSPTSLFAARYLEENLRDGDILAMSWGGTLREIVENFTERSVRRLDIQIVQLVGTLGSSHSEIDGANLVRRLAQRLDGQYFNLSAPLIVENAETRRALLQEPSIREVLDLACRASIALVGIGSVAQGASSAVRARLLNAAQLDAIRKQRAVGDICSQYFDVQGHLVAEEVNQHVVGLDLESLQHIPRVVGVATGEHKAKAILAALRGRWINVLITDELTANRVLQLDRRTRNLKPDRSPVRFKP